YIVSFKKHTRIDFEANVQAVKNQFIGRSESNQVLHKFDSVLNGISAKLDRTTLERVKALSSVERVEEDGIVQVSAVQDNASWGLARVSQRPKLGPSPYTYKYDDNAGEGVNIYILDTGINIDHEDFKGRITWGITTAYRSQGDNDYHGHGTHCAGSAAGTIYGVAKKAKIIAVKVLGDKGGGFSSDIIAGVNWVVKNKSGVKGNVISMRLAGGLNESLNTAVNDAVDQGVISIIAAGNYNKDACEYSPGSAKKAITVGSIDVNDTKAGNSNHGPCVGIHAPGVKILSTYIGNSTATKVLSGTSMATPHVAGLAATLLSQGIHANELETKLKSLGTPDIIQGLPEKTVNLLAYSG
ncbi:subtilisin-like protein, partial [Conidiobolus coronatus NRRL 28638]